MADGCVFCEIVAERAPATYIRRFTDAVAIVPLNPVTDGHTLVIPRIHVVNVVDSPQTAALVMQRAAQIARPPCNIITSVDWEATQTVPHLHLHIVPRRTDDGLALPWHGGYHRESIRTWADDPLCATNDADQPLVDQALRDRGLV